MVCQPVPPSVSCVTHYTSGRNATIYCGTEVQAVEWDNRGNKLLLLGTSGGNVKAWNVDNKRIVGDTSGDEAFPCFGDVQCSPTENLFVCATASHDPRFDLVVIVGRSGGVLRREVGAWLRRCTPPLLIAHPARNTGRLVVQSADLLRWIEANSRRP